MADDENKFQEEQLFQDWGKMKRLQQPAYWEEMREKVVRSLWRKRRLMWMRYAAFLLLSIGLGLSWWWMGDGMPEQRKVVSITPGEMQAILYLSDGEAIRLSRDSIFQIREKNGIQISNKDSGRVVYCSDKAVDKAVVYNTIVVPPKGEFWLTLADGTKVWLNSCTKLRYPINFSDDERRVELEGEAYFDVSRNLQKPFIVNTRDYSVRVLGTAFNVMSYSDDAYSRTTLVRGSVEIESTTEKKVLQPGEQAVYEQEHLTVRTVDTRYYTSWMNDRFYFDHERLDHILKQLSRWYGVQVEFEEENLRAYHFVGSVPKYKNIDDVCTIIEMTTNVNFEIKNNLLKVTIKK